MNEGERGRLLTQHPPGSKGRPLGSEQPGGPTGDGLGLASWGPAPSIPLRRNYRPLKALGSESSVQEPEPQVGLLDTRCACRPPCPHRTPTPGLIVGPCPYAFPVTIGVDRPPGGPASPWGHPPYTTWSSQLCGVYSSSGATLSLCAGQSMRP